jgi:hypothetical protein
MAYTRLERETTIVYNEQQKTAVIWSASSVLQRRMEKLDVKPQKKLGEGCWYEVPKSWIKVSRPRQVSEAQKAASRERMRKMHESHQSK